MFIGWNPYKRKGDTVVMKCEAEDYKNNKCTWTPNVVDKLKGTMYKSYVYVYAAVDGKPTDEKLTIVDGMVIRLV